MDAKQVVNDVNSRIPNHDVAGHFVEGIIMEMQGLTTSIYLSCGKRC
jgi:hypothetical protein